MAKEKTKVKEISITQSKGAFSLFKPSSSKNYNLEDVSSLRQIFSNEKARMLNVIKTQNPSSVYELAKMLGRSFKAVSDDIKLLKKFGFIELKEEKFKERRRLRPVIVVDTLNIWVKL